MEQTQTCYGEFICSNCGRVTKQKFRIRTKEDLTGLHIDCECGKRVETYIPVSMRDSILNLASKGYKMRMFNENVLGIVFNMKMDPEKLPRLPHEFVYDTTEPEGDILRNERMVYNDFEGIDKETYIKEAKENLLDFCRLLPTIEDGEYIDRSKEEDIIDVLHAGE